MSLDLNLSNPVSSLDLLTGGKSKIETVEKPNFDTNAASLTQIRDYFCVGFNVEFTLTANKLIRNKNNLCDINTSIREVMKKFIDYSKHRKIKYYFVYEKHKDGILHIHGILNVNVMYNEYLLRIASLYKYFIRRGLKMNWCRIMDLFRPYKSFEGNIKRKKAIFSNWFIYIHKEVSIDNKVVHNCDEYYNLIPKENKIPKSFRVLFNWESASEPESESCEMDDDN